MYVLSIVAKLKFKTILANNKPVMMKERKHGGSSSVIIKILKEESERMYY